MKQPAFRFYVDRGGTFTDIIAVAPDGGTFVHKLLSVLPGASNQSDATVRGIHEILQYARAHRLYPEELLAIDAVRVGTTVATNALLTRQGTYLVFVTNKGFKDSLQIGYQARPDIFALDIHKAQALYSETLEIDCRVDVKGNQIQALDSTQAKIQLAEIFKRRPDAALAIALMHSYKYPDDEKSLGEIAREVGFKQVSLSHQISQQIKFVGRGDTTCVDAYLTPVLTEYTANLAKELSNSDLQFIKSDGGLTDATSFRGKDALLSGPAGGVVGAVSSAKRHYLGPILGFDMGGTSTDVSYYDGQFDRLYETTISGVRVRTPMLAVHTVASGGGSILDFDGARLLVGPQSAGAYPGPACYGHGGPLTVTDANLVLGRICAANFPQTFGKSLKEPLNKERATALFTELGQKISNKTGLSEYQDIARLAYGYLEVATEKMSRALLKVSTERGHDISEATLVAFGGAGGQHACMIAKRLNIKRVLISPLAGVLSAYGIGQAPQSRTDLCTWQQKLSDSELLAMQPTFKSMHKKLLSTLKADDGSTVVEHRRLFLRYDGADTSIVVDYLSGDNESTLLQKFEHNHTRLFGFFDNQKTVTVSDIELELIAATSLDEHTSYHFITYQDETLKTSQDIYAAGSWHKVQPLTRKDLIVDQIITGPALLADATNATVIEPGWQAEVLIDGSLQLTEVVSKNSASNQAIKIEDTTETKPVCDPVKLELYNNIFMAIAEEMGLTLQQVSHSVNIKERLDFSCAIFDGQGRLIANAPHMPVHLGSMGEAVVSLIKACQSKDNQPASCGIKSGDVYLSNNPYNGGTHLPDITAISPVFLAGQSEPVFFVASRGHHADIGGITPGSMPPLSTSIEQEGTMLDNVMVMEHGQLLDARVRQLFLDNPYPARNIEQTISDIKAQIAANHKGIAALSSLAAQRGLSEVKSYMDFARANARIAVLEILGDLTDGQAQSTMDDGSIISVSITISQDKQSATIDFTGTSGPTNNNFNTPRAVVRAAVLYVFRTLTKRDIPLNDGCVEPLNIIIPPHSLLSPDYPRAVVAGNVETSQAIVDALYRCLGKLADSQGTMNNFTFGNEHYQYYETICGGAGAGNGFDGASAVQTHMTNSRLTDPEILESRYPVLLEQFSLRHGSGGTGLYQGGAGTVRQIRFLEAMQASILSNRRNTQPQGIKGGGAAMSGKTEVWRKDGTVEVLDYLDSRELKSGDSVVISTPGGGGYGSKSGD